MKYFPGLKLSDGSVIERIYRGERKWAYVYADDDPEGKGRPTRTILYRLRMDVRRPDGTMSPDKWYVIKDGMSSEYFVGRWDGSDPIAWDDANRRIEQTPCADCGRGTRRWDHIARAPVCWDCCDKAGRKRQDRDAYRVEAAQRLRHTAQGEAVNNAGVRLSGRAAMTATAKTEGSQACGHTPAGQGTAVARAVAGSTPAPGFSAV